MAQLFNLRKNLLANPDGNMMCVDARQPFTIKINTIYGTGNNTFALPLTNHTTNLKIETSDGQLIFITNYTDPAKLISFPSAGIYTIKMRGECGWSFNNTGDCQKLIGITRWGSTFKFSYLAGGFRGCINLGLNDGLSSSGYILSTEATPNIQYAFSNCNLSHFGHDGFLNKIKTNSLLYTFSQNKLTYISKTLLQGQIKVVNADYAFYNNPLLTDMHNDVFRDLINCQKAEYMLSLCAINIVRSGWFATMIKLTTMFNTLSNSNIKGVETGSFDSQVNVTDMAGVLSLNNLASLPNRLMYNCKKVISYQASFRNQKVPMALPAEIWDLSAISIVTNCSSLLSATTTALSPTGTVQPIWNYTSPTATKVDAFANCTALTNYGDIPTDWI